MRVWEPHISVPLHHIYSLFVFFSLFALIFLPLISFPISPFKHMLNFKETPLAAESLNKTYLFNRYLQTDIMKSRLNIDNDFSLSLLANIPLRFQLLDPQDLLQSSRRNDWVRSSPDQATYLLEYTILQDLPRYETRSRDKIVCRPHASQLSTLADRWWEISKDIQGSRHVEVVDWSESIVTETLQQRRVQRNEWLGTRLE